MTASTTLLRTPFHDLHVAHGAKLVEFAGWEMPMLYGSIIDEHRQVRNSGGLFDVSHMGRVRFGGPDAGRFLDRVCTRAVQSMKAEQCRYTLMCNDAGGCRDDTLVYRLGHQDFIVVCNAANRLKLLDHWQQERGSMDVTIDDETVETGMLALQGPNVMELVEPLVPEVSFLKRYRFREAELFGVSALVSRTGYTGEDGVEVILPADAADTVMNMLEGHLGDAVKPAGLGARDTLRLEAAMPLYGHEIDEERDPVSAGLHFAMKLDKEESFIGQEALQKIAAEGPRQQLVGLRLEGRRTARQGMSVHRDGNEVGVITSACLSPTLECPIAMGYVDRQHAETDTRVTIDLGRATADATIVARPFYKV